ncbi:MAG: gamma-glutamyltransferase, partial [Porticoccaceae bacterium]|nr:gamma-glutamyltransferase [Porticoccaceae bacterium]
MKLQDIVFPEKLKIIFYLAVTSIIFFAGPVYGAEAPIIDYRDRFHPVVSTGGMVVSQERLASQVGAAILADGGNAIDAAVATGFALAVTLPQAGNLGGGGFMLIYLAEEHKTLAVDYREMAPAAAMGDLFLDEQGEVDQKKARFSHLSAGVPGTVAGLIHAQKQYGSLPLREVMAPAISLAAKGIRVSDTLAFSLDRAGQRLARWPSSKKYFFRSDGSALQSGDLWPQKDLAKTLQAISSEGRKAFYQGEIAKLIVEDMEKNQGLITHQDLANYRVVEREAVQDTYRGFDIATMPPPSSGGVHLIQMLNILEGWQLAELGHNSAAYLHRLIESMRRAYADRSEYLGDPDFHPVPVAQLIDKAYAKKLRASIDLDKATPSTAVSPGLPPGVKAPYESPQTTHFSVWD